MCVGRVAASTLLGPSVVNIVTVGSGWRGGDTARVSVLRRLGELCVTGLCVTGL